MSDDTSIAADLSAAMSATAPSSETSVSAAPDATEASTGTATTAPATDATAVSTQAPPDPAQKQGPIPFDVHSKALDNARAKAVAEKQAEWEREYGWATQVDREAVAEASRLGQLYTTDKAGFVRELIASGDLDPALVSEFARVLSSRRGQQTTPDEADLSPDVPLLDQHGNPTGQATYSAPRVQALVNHAVQQAIAQVTKDMAPLQETHKAVQEQRKQAERQTFAVTTTADFRKQPFFTEHEPAIKAEFAKEKIADPDNRDQVNAALQRAYNRVLTTTVIPGLQSASVKTVVQDQQTKAAANTVSPGSPGGGVPKDFSKLSWSEAFKAEMAARGR